MEEKTMYHLTNPQKSIFLTEQYFQGTAINNICGSVLIEQEIDLEMLNKAINYFIRNNDSFKLHFKLVNGELLQYFTDDKDYKFEILNIKEESEIEQVAKKICSVPFNLIDSKVFDFKLFKLSSGFGGFIVKSHHIISDAATFGMIGTEIVSNYKRLKNNEEIPIKQYSYKDYITAEKDYLVSDRYKKDKDYWNELYSNIPDVATIPSLKNENKNACANRLEFQFNKDILYKINTFCKNNKISIYNFLMAIYSLYIGRINNTNNFSIGTPVLNRSNYAQKHTSGMFISTSLLKINIENNLKFYEFTQNIAKNSLSMFRHQKYSYNDIIDDLRKIHTDISNLYDIVLSYQVTKATDINIGIPYKSTWHMTPYISNSMNIHFHDNNDEGNLLIEYDYKTCKYEEEDIINMHNRILYIIEQVIENPDIYLSDVEIITEEEENKILYEFNNTDTVFQKDKTLVQLFEEQAEKNPNNIAVVFEEKKLTYKELNEKANSLANYLISKGIKNKDNICICLNRSLELIIAIYAVIKSGASYVLIDTELPKERIDYIINDSNAKYCIVNDLTYNLGVQDKSININILDFSKYRKDNVLLKNQSDSLCIIYTSGSTGKPKGVLLHKHGFVNLVLGFDKEISISKYKSFLGLANVSFDMFAFTLFNATLLGNTFILTNENELKSPIEISKLIRKNKVEFLVTTPSIIELLLLEKSENALANIKAFVLGGEQFHSNLYNRLRNVTDGKIYNGYGPTEITACCSLKLISSNENITIGNPIPNVQIYICDSNMKLLPIGVTGEICVGGYGVAEGYLNNKELTNKSFIKNPFGDGYVYKTGDMGMYTINGEITCLGRYDNQIKIRGLRIELGEIENKINDLSYINACAVIKREDSESREFLCAYFTANTIIDTINIRKSLEKSLPRYMIPSYFIQLDSFPHTTNGKIDRKNLPEPKYTNSNLEIILPRNNLDEKLIEILKKILKIKSIGINDNFFELGGDSLSAINLCIQIKEEFNVQLFVKDILESSTIQDLSDNISKKKHSEALMIKSLPKAEFYDVSSAQRRIYFASKLAGNDSILYNTPGGVILEGNIDEKKLEEVLKTLIKRHEAFRTYFELNNETVVQKIAEKVDFKLDILENADFRNIDEILKEFIKPFDLSKAPLFRAKMVRFINGKSAILMDMHHIISDGTSMAIFTDELCKLYNGEKLPEIAITYKDFSAFENHRLSSGKLKEAEEYWLHQFEDKIPVLNMPTNYSRPAIQTFEGNKIYATINSEMTKRINHISRELRITPFMILISCYYILLSKYTSQEDIIVGSPIVNRDLADTNSLIGMFVNTIALRNKIDENISFKKFVLNIKNNMLEAYKYQAYPFDELINKLNIKRDTSRSPLFDTMFTYQNNGLKKMEFKDIKTEYYIPNTNISKFDLSLEAMPTNNEINLSFEYATKLFNSNYITNLSKHYLNILSNVLENINIKISDIDMLSKKEKNKILYEFNNTSVDYPKDKTIIELFEEQVTKTPNNLAVVFENQKLSYKELNEKANSLANFLKDDKKIKRNDLIGIMIERSPEMIIAILAVLKSGGVYIPIDPTYPKDRINYMLKNSKAKLLLTQKHLQNVLNFENTVLIDLNNNDIYNLNTDNLAHINQPEDLAYVIFTSGSTGMPKGVMIKQRNIINFIYGMMNEFKFTDTNTIVSLTTISFDIFVLESLMPLLNGLKVVVANEEEQTNVKLFNELCLKNEVDIIQTTPSRMNGFTQNTDSLEFIKKATHILIGGEPFTQALLNKLKQISNAKIYNMYGPTETAVWSTVKDLTNTDVITIGRPIINTQIYNLDSKLKPLPIGVPGELYISGDGVGKGYLNNDELTRKSFIPNPYISNTLMYKTGDIGSFTEDGEIICLGRSDNQVKVRGLRIELGEIESLILKYPGIKNACVIKQIINNREFISAYYVTSKRIIIKELKKYLSNSLPRYMVPSYYIALDDFIYTPNGKIDKKALPVATEILSISKEEYVAPKTNIQKQLVKIWEKILNTEPIGINDNFFELGGDSLLAMNLNLELMNISKKITYQDIFRFPTIVELEEKINSNEDKPIFSKIENLSYKLTDILKDSTKNKAIRRYHPKNILLTGATGFLGIHILQEFIRNEKGNIYCIIREEPGITARTKLYQKLNYYFGNKYDNLIDNRIFTITGDITEPGFGLKQEELLKLANSVDLVINCAANVSHYGNYNDFYNTNVKSVKYIIDFCKSFNKRIYHISTISISGRKLDLSYPTANLKNNITFDESSLYVGQTLENVYVRSKFEAEVYILDAISKGLDGYILRLGNIMPRYSDGKFQENIKDNAFINKVISFIKMEMYPDYILKEIIEFTPVDCVAKAIYKLVTHMNNTNRIFHLYNHNYVPVETLLKIIRKYGYNINILSEEKFKNKINDILKDEKSKNLLNSLMNDFNKDLHLDYKNDIIIKSKFTIKYLRKTFFKWPKISKKYLIRFVKLLKKEI